MLEIYGQCTRGGYTCHGNAWKMLQVYPQMSHLEQRRPESAAGGTSARGTGIGNAGNPIQVYPQRRDREGHSR